jgi:hypothetical protein
MLATSSFLAYIVATSKQLAHAMIEEERGMQSIYDDSSLINNWSSLLQMIVTFQPTYLFYFISWGKKIN